MMTSGGLMVPNFSRWWPYGPQTSQDGSASLYFLTDMQIQQTEDPAKGHSVIILWLQYHQLLGSPIFLVGCD